MVRATFVSLLLTGMVVFVMGVPGGSAEERVEGKVVKTHLTACGVVPGKAGTCEGTMELERQVGEQSERMMVQITRDTVLKKGEEKAFLFQLEGGSATVSYVKEGDQKVATSVVTKPAGR